MQIVGGGGKKTRRRREKQNKPKETKKSISMINEEMWKDE